MNYLAVDVDYRAHSAHTAGIAFSDTAADIQRYQSIVHGVEGYVSGEFYKRELPCILSLLQEHHLTPECIFIDGYVYLEGAKPGLGWHLYEALERRVIVIGVAKNPRGKAMEETQVFRGGSKKPLYVTCEGIDLAQAKKLVKTMAGPFRIPTLLKMADTLCRQ